MTVPQLSQLSIFGYDLTTGLRVSVCVCVCVCGSVCVSVLWERFWMIESMPLSRHGGVSVPYYVVVGVCIDEHWRRLLANMTRTNKNLHTHSSKPEITAVLSCYAAVAPSARITPPTHTQMHRRTYENETRTVTPGLAGSEGHRGIVTKLPSNQHGAHIISSAWPWPDPKVVMMHVDRWWLFCTWLSMQKCVKCAGASQETTRKPRFN